MSAHGRPGASILLGRAPGTLFGRDVRLGPGEIATHKHIIGKTGQGKSKLIQAMYVQLVGHGIGASLLDPHHYLARDTLAYFVANGFFERPEAFERLRYIDFASGGPVPFNVLRSHADPHDTAYSFLEAVKRAWPSLTDGGAPMLENIVLASSQALAEVGRPVTDMSRLLTDSAFRDEVLGRVSDPFVVDYFRQRYERRGVGAAQQAESTLRRLFLLTFAPALRGPLGQRANLLDFRRFMDDGVSVIYDLGGVENPEAKRLLGCLITVGYELAAMTRANSTGHTQHHLILDEFAEYVAQSGEALARMLAMARKYNLFLTLANQTWSQTSVDLRGALQNVGVQVAFRLGRADAEVMARDIGTWDVTSGGNQREAWARSIQGLGRRQAYVKSEFLPTTMIETITVPDREPEAGRLREVLETYKTKYHVPDAVPTSRPSSGARYSRPGPGAGGKAGESPRLWNRKR